MSEYSPMQLVKRRFFAMRNGVIADTIRRAGFGYKIIFGLNLPQIVEISRSFGHDPALAAQLWSDIRCRESRLLAPMLLDPATLTPESALAMASEVNTTEVADILCHRLLRHRPDLADSIVTPLLASGEPLKIYTALRLLFNRLASTPFATDESAALARSISATLDTVTPDPLTSPIILSLRDEISFRLDP